jgi:hypothetical protein
LVDLIFPNRGTPGHDPESWLRQPDRAEPTTSHRKTGGLSGLFSRKTKVIQVASGRTGRRGGRFSAVAGLPVRRRRLLLGIGTGVVAVGGAGGAAALLTGAIGSWGDGKGRPNTAVEGLGAAGWPSRRRRLPGSRRRPPRPGPPRSRATPNCTCCAARRSARRCWTWWRCGRWASTPGSSGSSTRHDRGRLLEQIAEMYPTTAMTSEQIRATLKANDNKAQNELGRATLARQIWSSRQLYEVMVDFWSNHLNVTNPFDGGWDTRTEYDNTVIRANALGRFSDMLVASARSPAMMRYLDNFRSDKRSVNENYGRELLELHTVGLGAKYTEDDVRQSAYILTGRTVDNNGKFYYDPKRHWTGAVKVLDFTHPNEDAAAASSSARRTWRTSSTTRPRPTGSRSSWPAGSSVTTRRRPWSTGWHSPIWTMTPPSSRCCARCSARSSSGCRPASRCARRWRTWSRPAASSAWHRARRRPTAWTRCTT